jgi:hypothetical protein
MNTLIRDRFQPLAVALLAAAVVVGFARTYYLRPWFELPPLTRTAHIHGLMWTAWLLLHYVQARLVAAHRADLHRKLGLFTAALGVALVITSGRFAIDAVLAGRAPPGRVPLEFLSVSLGTTFMFALFFGAALVLRQRREWHKRLMLLASIVVLLPAIGRLDSLMFRTFGTPVLVLPILVSMAFVAWLWINDRRTRGAVHPVSLVGGTLLVAAIPFRWWLGTTEAWMPFARWVTE